MNPTHPLRPVALRPVALRPVALWPVALWRCWAALTIAVCVLVASMLAPRSRAEPIALTPDQLAIIDSIAKPQGGDTVGYASAPTDPIGAEVRLPFGEGRFITLRRKGSTLREDGSISWYGEVAETGERALLMVWDKALLTGYFAYKGTVFAVESLGGGVHAFAELNRGQQLPDHPDPVARADSVPIADRNGMTKPPSVPVEPNVPGFTDTDRKALEAKNITIDVMILYTQNVAKRYIRDPADLLALAVDEANQSFKGSGLGNIRLRLVHTEAVDYDTTADDQFTHLYTMVDGLGPFKGVRKLRDDKRADIVGLIIDNPKGCGLSTRVRPDSDEAFFVVHHACASTTMSIAHEIGHVLGIRHDRFVDQSNTPFAYGHGYVNGTKWRDIMSYNEGCGGCPRIPYWSNPRIMYKGEPTGTDAADSARVILELAERVSKFR
jgi:Metallo-peptidase family M12